MTRKPRARSPFSRAAAAVIERLEKRALLAGVVISELVAENANGLRDEDGQRSDWVEIHNTDAAPMNIGGWYLTDDLANLTKWQFPTPTTLAADEYLVVFASDKNRAVAGQELHTNFKLTSAGENLALVMADGTTVASSYASFPAQYEDKSYGIAPSRSATTNVDLVPDNAPALVLSPAAQSAAVDDFWREINFVPGAGWISTTTGVGFDRDDGALDTYIGAELDTTQMPSARLTAYVRIPFTVTDKDQLTSLALSLRYDDGFIAYLNGREVKRVNFDNTLKPAWDSRANSNRPDAQVAVPTTFDLTPYLLDLVNGDNVLAIHGVNHVSQSGDFLIDPILSAQRATGTPAVSFMATPTPGENNGVGTAGFVGDTHFSVDRGFFTSPFQVSISADEPGSSIRYTLDGSAPTETTGTLYSGPIDITTTKVLRAIAYKTGFTSSDVDTETYIFLNDVIHQSASGLPAFAPWSHFAGQPGDWEMDPDVVNNPTYSSTIIDDLKAIPSVSLVMNWNDLFGTPPDGIYTSSTPSTRESVEKYASMEFFTADASDQFHLDVAVEVQGGSSAIRWNADKLSLQVKFKFPYGPTKLDHAVYTHPLFDQSAVTDFDTFILDAQFNYAWIHSNSAQNSAAKYIQDQVVSDLQNLTGGGAPHGKFVHLYLNGLYWGIYDMHERPDDSMASAYYSGSSDDYDVIKHQPTNWADGGITAVNNYATLLNATRQNMSTLANYQAVANILDIDQFIDYMLVHYYGGNFDWGGDNWYATHSRVDPNGKWRFHAWDQEHAFSDVNFDLTTYNQANNNINGGPIEIHYNLLVSPEYKLCFADHVQKLFFNGGALTPAAVANVYQARMTEIDRAIVGESARWGDNRVTVPYTRANWVNTQNNVLNNFIPQRTNIVVNQFIARGWLQSLAAPVFSSYGGTVNSGFQLAMSKPGGSPGSATIYYTIDGADPRVSGTGALAPTAVPYSGPITINAATRVKARIRDGSSWSPIIDATFLLPDVYPVRIVELHYHPDIHPAVTDPEDLEFIELLNTGVAPVSLDGVQITEYTSTPYTFPNGITLQPGARIIVARSPSVFSSVYGTSGITLSPLGYSTANLSNGGERIALHGPQGETIQDFVYDDVSPWPTTPDGDGPSLEIIDPLGDPGDPANWRASLQDGGSPGAEGSPAAPLVNSIDFEFETARVVKIVFTEDVSASLAAGDLVITPQPSGSSFPAISYSWNSSTRTVMFALPTSIADGDYLATLPAGSVDNGGTPLASPAQVAFFTLTADANRDRTVDTIDFNILAANFGQSLRPFSEGNFDYDAGGSVDTIDFNLLATNFGKTLPSAPAARQAPYAPPPARSVFNDSSPIESTDPSLPSGLLA